MSTGAPSIDIEVDSILFNDSDYESNEYQTTESLQSSINEYIVENGRRYHAYYGVDKNVLPTDETEQSRMDLHHEVFLMLMHGQLFNAPIQDPGHILDIGTGTGIWAIEVADTFPNSQVVGLDLSPIQPNWVPPNCRFEVDDVEQEWTYPSDFYDLIHVRNLCQSIDDWPKLMSEIFRCTTPGGYAELAELGTELFSDDGTLASDNPGKVHIALLNEAMSRIGRRPQTGDTMKELLEKAGFENINVLKLKQPLGQWPKEKRLKHVGTMNIVNGETGFHAYGMAAFTRILGMETKDADELCTSASKSIRNRNIHSYTYFYVAYGQKPGGGYSSSNDDPSGSETDVDESS